jgi:hypothetical protein
VQCCLFYGVVIENNYLQYIYVNMFALIFIYLLRVELGIACDVYKSFTVFMLLS